MNPFGALDPDVSARLAVTDVEPWLSALRACTDDDADRALCSARMPQPPSPPPAPTRLALQLVGPPGSGKSTALAALSRRLDAARSIGWSADSGWPTVPTPSPAHPEAVLLVDDAHLMTPTVRSLVLDRTRLALATHVGLEPTLRAAGYEVHTVRMAELASTARLRTIVDRRLEWARRGPGATPRIDDGVLRSLTDRYGPDLRSILGALYEMIERHPPLRTRTPVRRWPIR